MITHDNSAQRERCEELLLKVQSALSGIEHFDFLNLGLVKWQPEERAGRNPYFTMLKFKILTGTEWFNFSLLRSVALAIFVVTKELLTDFRMPKARSRYLFRSLMVSEKHLDSWKRALDFGCDILIVLEDDAILKLSLSQIASQISAVLRLQDPVFVNLSGGNDLQKFNLRPRDDIGPNWRASAVADTMGAYALNKSAMNEILNQLQLNPSWKRLGCDFMISYALIKNKRIVGLINTTPPVINGTINGIFATELWQTKVNRSD